MDKLENKCFTVKFIGKILEYDWRRRKQLNRKVRLGNDLLGHLEHDSEQITIPAGSEIEVKNADYSDIESEVLWNGVTLLVNMDSLITFEEPIEI